jgi:hypothetical protein
MTTRGGDAKKNQKYHNETAYEVRFNQRKLDINASAPLDRLCVRCMEQVRWKIQFGKYKPATSLARCNKCKTKNINKAYRTVCDRCADKEHCCSKCGQSKDIAPNPKPEIRTDRTGVDRSKLQKMEEYLEDLRERSKRTVMRKLMKGEVEWSQEDGYFITTDDGKPLPNLRFKADVDEMEDNWGDDDDEDDGDDDDLDEDDEEEAKVSDKKKGKDVKKDEKDKAEEKKEEEPKKEIKGILKNKQQEQQKQQQKKKKQESEDDLDDDEDDLDDDEDL